VILERELGNRAASELESAGFVVQREVRSDTIGKRSIQVDIVAWAPAENGELAPELVVEVKRLPEHELQAAAMQLQFYLPVVGALQGYVFNGTWYMLSDDFQTVIKVDCPRPRRGRGEGRAPTRLLEELILKSMDRMRGQGTRPEESWQLILDAVASGSETTGGIEPLLMRLALSPQNRPLIADVLIDATQRFNAHSAISGHLTPLALRQVLVRLLAPQRDWTIADPFCGFGTLLTAVNAEMEAQGLPCRLVGGEVNAHIAASAEKLLALAGVAATIKVGDSLADMPAKGANGIVTNPPLGMRLTDSHPLSVGGATRDAMLLIVDKIVASLADGGRAVLLVPPGFLFAAGPTEEFRRALAGTSRVVSVIEIAASVLSGTTIHPAILVLEKNKPGDTLVARLESDWEDQLSESGAFLKAYVQHLGGRA